MKEITQTMTSLEVVEVINNYRDVDNTLLRHDNFVAKVRKLATELGLLNIQESSYKNSQNKTQPMLILDKETCLLMVASETPKVLQAIIKRWQELEQATQVIANTLEVDKEAMLKDLKLDASIEVTKANIEVAKAKGEAAKLKLQALKDKLIRDKTVLESRTAKLLAQGTKIKADMTVSKLTMPIDTITNLLAANGNPMDAQTANNILVKIDFLSLDKTSVTDAGSYYGRTIKPSPRAKTSVARWFVSEFDELLPILIANK